jgi:hypothetical protein
LGEIRRYLQDVTGVLVWDWVEGTALQSLAEQIWTDPLSQTNRDETAFAGDVFWARKAAAKAVTLARAAYSLKQRHAAAFRYTVP